jgi:hypothetical protein
MTASTRNWFVGAPLLCALMPLVCVPAAEWMAIAPQGNGLFLWLTLIFVFPALAAVPAIPIALAGLFLRRVRRYASILALCSVAYLLAFIVSLRLGESLRMSAFHRLAERSKPLVAAVRAFEQKHGRPPESLKALVPEFLPSVPSTGLGAYPEYRYSTPATNHGGNPWIITVFTPSGGINFDQFMYLPLTNYPKRGYGGWLERVGDWAYVHE